MHFLRSRCHCTLYIWQMTNVCRVIQLENLGYSRRTLLEYPFSLHMCNKSDFRPFLKCFSNLKSTVDKHKLVNALYKIVANLKAVYRRVSRIQFARSTGHCLFSLLITAGWLWGSTIRIILLSILRWL